MRAAVGVLVWLIGLGITCHVTWRSMRRHVRWTWRVSGRLLISQWLVGVGSVIWRGVRWPLDLIPIVAIAAFSWFTYRLWVLEHCLDELRAEHEQGD